MYNNEGTLSVRAYTAGGALPVSGATVRIFGAEEENKDTVYSLLTDEDGITEKIALKAPNASLSLDSENQIQPYSLYNLEISKEGYYAKKLFNLPVFANTDSIQPIAMIPFSSLSDNYPNGNINANETNLY